LLRFAFALAKWGRVAIAASAAKKLSTVHSSCEELLAPMVCACFHFPFSFSGVDISSVTLNREGVITLWLPHFNE